MSSKRSTLGVKDTNTGRGDVRGVTPTPGASTSLAPPSLRRTDTSDSSSCSSPCSSVRLSGSASSPRSQTSRSSRSTRSNRSHEENLQTSHALFRVTEEVDENARWTDFALKEDTEDSEAARLEEALDRMYG